MLKRHIRFVPVALVVTATIATAAFAGLATATPTGRSTGAGLELPAPTGRNAIGTTTLHLVDRSRRDPFAGGRRELMVQLWYPAGTPHTRLAPYLTPGTASSLEDTFGLPEHTFESLRTHGSSGTPILPGRHPLLLFSHGLSTLRAIHTSLIEELASRGYIVAAIDHTYDAALVEFPNGRVVRGVAPAQPTLDETATLLATRVADVRFVLDRLSRLARARTGLLAQRLDRARVGALGHSFGGATAAAAMLADPRIRAGINLDGKVWGPVVSRGLKQPFMLVVGDSFGGGLTPDQTQFASRLRGRYWALRVIGAGHFSFSDLGRFTLALPGLGEVFDVGTVDAARADRAVRVYVAAFFDTVLRGTRGHLLDGPSPTHPGVRFLEPTQPDAGGRRPAWPTGHQVAASRSDH